MVKGYMNTHSHSHIVLILLSAILGALATGLIVYYPHAQHAVTTPVNAAGLNSFDDMFVTVVAKTTPAVVTITAQAVVPGSTQQGPPDLFKNLPPWFKFPFDENQGGDSSGGSSQPPQLAPVMGSGWIYSEDGYIVTNAHVVAGAKNIKVKLHDVDNDIRQYPAKIIGTDPKTELAVIKIIAPRKLPTLTLGDSDSLRIGQWVIAAGAPFEYEQTVTAGIISAKGRELRGENKYIQLGGIVQTDASINPGNSGGPLVDLHGNVIGINVAIAAAGPTPANVGIGFAIPASTAKAIIPKLIKSGKIVRGWLGITIRDLTANMRDFYGAPDGGVLVQAIREDGPSAKSDLKPDDIIVGANGQKVTDTYALQTATGDTPPGNPISLDVLRDKKPVKVTVTLGEMPATYAGLEQSQGAQQAQPGQEAQQAQPEAAPKVKVIGISVTNLTSELATQMKMPDAKGVVVVAIDPDSPAVNALDSGMVITRINHDEVTNTEQFKQAMAAALKSGVDYMIVQVKLSQDGEVATTSLDVPLTND